MNDSNAIQLTHTYAHPPAAVWRALTDPEAHARWWAGGDVRAVEGHRFDLDMGAWGKQPCEVVAVEPERLFRFRFATGTLDTVITWTLVPEGSGARLGLRHEGFDLDSPMGRQAREGMGAGWPSLLEKLEAVLQG